MNTRSDIHDRLAQSLREARRARGLSLDAVAKLSGVSRSMVSQIERGESSPTVATLWNLTQALQVAVQNRVISPILAGAGPVAPPWPVRLLQRLPWLRRLPARLIGIGVRPEHIGPQLAPRGPN